VTELNTSQIDDAGLFTAHQAIFGLIFGYSAAVDRGDFTAVGELFRHGEYIVNNGAVSLPGTAIGQRFEQVLRRYEDGTPQTMHVNPNVVVKIDPGANTATARTPVQVFQEIDGDIRCIYAGHYDDSFERRADGWVFRSRSAIASLLGDMSHHLLNDERPVR